jgi:hypothetical protein
MGIAKRFVPASFVLGDTRRVLDARDDVNDHKEMIRGMTERGVPGFAHDIMIKEGGEAVEVFAQVPLDGGKPVTYVDSYDGQVPPGARTMHNASNMREALTYEAADSLEHWAMRTEAAAHDNLRAEATARGEDPDMNGAEADATARTAVSIAYQQPPPKIFSPQGSITAAPPRRNNLSQAQPRASSPRSRICRFRHIIQYTANNIQKIYITLNFYKYTKGTF